MGNAQRLEQVMINLIINACQALLSREKKVHVETSYNHENNKAEVCIQDEGTGIGKDDLRHIMDPFFTTKRESGGTGLGLSISSRIVNEHKGSIEFRSTPGKWTKVLLSFPVALGYDDNKKEPSDETKN